MSLKYSPKEIGGHFFISNNKLKSLEYGPENVGRGYYCDKNYLISLKDLTIKHFNGDFYCDGNYLTSLKYGPVYIDKEFDCSMNSLRTLEYGPEYVRLSYLCKNNILKDFKGCAKYVGKILYAYNNPYIYSFEGIPHSIKGLECKNTILYNVWKLFEDVSKIELFNDMDIIREDNSGNPVIILNRLNEFLYMIGKPKVKKVIGYINI